MAALATGRAAPAVVAVALVPFGTRAFADGASPLGRSDASETGGQRNGGSQDEWRGGEAARRRMAAMVMARMGRFRL
jgi:hypothetical protein